MTRTVALYGGDSRRPDARYRKLISRQCCLRRLGIVGLWPGSALASLGLRAWAAIIFLDRHAGRP